MNNLYELKYFFIHRNFEGLKNEPENKKEEVEPIPFFQLVSMFAFKYIVNLKMFLTILQ